MIKYKIVTALADELIDPNIPQASLDGLNNWLRAGIALEPNPLESQPELRGPITRWIGYTFGKPRITKTEAEALLDLVPGDPNPFFQVLDAVTREGGILTVGESPEELSEAAPITREIWLTLDYVSAVVMSGGDVEGYQVFFGVDDPSVEVPLYFPQRTYTEVIDGVETELVHTFNTWGAPYHTLTEINGKFYRSNAVGYSGELMTGQLFIQARQDPSVDLLSKKEYQDLLIANSEIV